jgi:HD-like signal output (HDOD) protein
MSFLKRSPRPVPQPPGPGTPAPGVATISDEHLLYIHTVCPTRSTQAGDTVVENQKSLDNLYVVVKGSLEITLTTTPASATIELSKGKLFGFLPEKDDQQIYYTIRSTSAAVFIEVSQRIFENFPHEIQRKIYSDRHKSNLEILYSHIENHGNLSERNSRLVSYIHELHYRSKKTISSELIQSIIKKIPKIPAHTQAILSKLMNENTSGQEVTESIHRDPALVGLILKTVNSSYYGLSQKISDVHHAILYLGFNNVYQLIINQTMKSLIDNNEEFMKIQSHATLISIIGHEISKLSKKSKPMTIMTTGLLHDIGKAVIVLLKNKYPNIQDLFEMLDDAAIGASLLQSWGLPEQIFHVVEHHRVPEFCPPDRLPAQYKDDIAILYVAHVYHDILTDTYASSTIYLNDYLVLLGAPPRHSGQYYEEALRAALLKSFPRLPAMARTLLQDKLQVPNTHRAAGIADR